jgi:hypothetical protein
VTASRLPAAQTFPVASLAPSRSFTSPIIDYEPPPVGMAALCPPPSPAALHRHTPRRLRPVPAPPAQPPRAAAVFTDTALRRILEVVDRRRPVAQLRPLLAPTLIDAVVAMTRTTSSDGAVLRPPPTARQRRPRCSPPTREDLGCGPSPAASRSSADAGSSRRCRSVEERAYPRLAFEPSRPCLRAASRRSRRDPPVVGAACLPP